MHARRPTILLIVAILNFVGAVLSIAVLAVVVLATWTRDADGLPEVLADSDDLAERIELELQKPSGQLFEAKVPSHPTARRAEIAGAFILAVLMIAAGIGLLLTKPWGRLLSIIYALASLSNHALCLVYLMFVVLPGIESLSKDSLGGFEGPDLVLRRLETALVWIWLAPRLTLLYPLSVFIVMLMPSVAASFSRDTSAASLAQAAPKARAGPGEQILPSAEHDSTPPESFRTKPTSPEEMS